MSQQESDLPRFIQIIGRYRALIGLMAVLGLLAGAAFAALNPAGSSTSEADVLFSAPQCPDGGICGGSWFSPGYLNAAVLQASPSGVQIKMITGNVVSVSAVGGTAAQAEAAANAAVRSYVALAGSLSYLGEHPSVIVLAPVTTQTAPKPSKGLFDDALLGALFGVLAGIIAALAGSRSTIEPVTLPKGLGISVGARAESTTVGRAGVENASRGTAETGRETGYAPAGVSLHQLAMEHLERSAASDGPLDGREAEPAS